MMVEKCVTLPNGELKRKMLKQISCLKKKFLGRKNEKDKIYG
jgi:hypothetical protein